MLYLSIREKTLLGSFPLVKHPIFPVPGGTVLAYVSISQSRASLVTESAMAWAGVPGQPVTRLDSLANLSRSNL